MKRKFLCLLFFLSIVISACGSFSLEEGRTVTLDDGSLVKTAVDLSVNSDTCITEGDQQVVIEFVPWLHENDDGVVKGRFYGEDHVIVRSFTGNFVCEDPLDSLAAGWVFPRDIDP